MLDDVFADAPTDAGASITTVKLRLSRGTTTRFAFMDRFAAEIGPTTKIGCALAGMDAFEPWPLKFNVDGHQLLIPDLFVIRRAMFDDGRFAPLLQEYGMSCARMLSLHRLSLFRAGGLLATAKAFLGRRRDARPDEDTDSATRPADNRPAPASLAPAQP